MFFRLTIRRTYDELLYIVIVVKTALKSPFLGDFMQVFHIILYGRYAHGIMIIIIIFTGWIILLLCTYYYICITGE